ESDRRGAALASVPAHDHDPAGVARALPDAEQGVHAELLHCAFVEHLDADAKLAQRGGAPREFLGKKHVGGLIDEIAREKRAIRDRRALAPGLARALHIGDPEREAPLSRPLLALLALGLVAVERIGAQFDPERHVSGLLGLHRAARKLENEGRFRGTRRDPAHGRAAQLDEILDVRRLPDADHDEARRLEPLGRDDVERRPVPALEIVGGGRAGEEITGRFEHRLRGRPEAQAIVGEYHQDSPRRRRYRGESCAQPIGHGGGILVAGYIAAGRWQERSGGRVPYSIGFSVARYSAPFLPSIGFTGSLGISRTWLAPGGAAKRAQGDGDALQEWDGSTVTYFAPASVRSR